MAPPQTTAPNARDAPSAAEVAEIEGALLAALPETATDLDRQEVRRIAELRVLTARLRGKALRGRRVDLDKLAKLEGLADRIWRRLLAKPAPKLTLPPWLTVKAG